jgi:hypothetical protein
MAIETCLRFVPSRVEGLANVTAGAVYADRLELQSAGERLVFRFEEMVEWPRPAWLWRFLARIGWRPKWLPIGERDWFHKPSQRFFRFFTSPRLTVFMPDESPDTQYGSTVFRRIQEVMAHGGFDTWDLG